MSVQNNRPLETASAAHAAILAVGKEIADVGPRAVAAAKALRSIGDTVGRVEMGDYLYAPNPFETAAATLEAGIADATAVVATADKYYATAALHGGAAMFLADVSKTLPHLESFAASLSDIADGAEPQARIAAITAYINGARGP